MPTKEVTFETDEAYYGDKEYLSNSMLKDFAECQHKFKMKHVTKKVVFEDKPYFLIGRALDTLITEGADKFEQKFEVVTRRKKGAERQQLTAGDYDLVLTMLTEVLRQPLVKKLKMTPSKCQEVVAMEIDGVKRKGKLDYFDKNKKIIMDLKTTANLLTFNPMMYAMQLAYYRQLIRAKYGIECECHLFAVDKRKPKCRSQYYIYSKEVLDDWEMKINTYIEEYQKAKQSKKYSGPISRHRCFDCELYPTCPLAKQKKPISITRTNVY